MTLWLWPLACLALTVVSAFGAVHLKRPFPNEGLPFWCSAIATFVFTFLTIVSFSGSAGFVHQERRCNDFGEVTGHEVEFKRYHIWSGQCFVTLENGSKVPLENFRGFN